ncbi:hypothetical protein BH09VER1_BH09VER1_08130 [soil metagenome]
MLMKSVLFVLLLAAGLARAVDPADLAHKKIYECPYVENPPYGVLAWAASDIMKDAKRTESRFVDYKSDAARGLVLDATTERDVTKDNNVSVRKTTFAMAYNAKGWYIYIEGEEPLIKPLLDSLLDPKSPARKEGYEVFFTPGLHRVPYYQIMPKSFANTVAFVDWGMPHRDYRSLEPTSKVESMPLEKGVGTFLFIPWEGLYEWAPVDGDYWRFSIVRWMPYSKAGGVTWGGLVHDTGNFGLVHFQKPTAEQKTALEKRLLRIAWFTYLAKAKALTAYWSDDRQGDPKFYETALKPVVDKFDSAGAALGDPETWTAESVEKSQGLIGDWMEFNYKVGELRDQYLVDKRFADGK